MEEGRPPSVLVVGEGQVVTLPAHGLDNQAHAAPGAEPGLDRVERWRLGSATQRETGEAEGSEEEGPWYG